MNRILAILLRFAAMLVGYAAAALAASAFLHLLFLGPLGWTGEEALWLATGSMVFSVPLLALFVAYAAFIPAAAVVGLGELLGRTDWLFHAIGGAIVGAVVIIVIGVATAPRQGPVVDGDLGPGAATAPIGDPGVLAVMIGAGIVGGIVYWAVAGRGAGNWRR